MPAHARPVRPQTPPHAATLPLLTVEDLAALCGRPRRLQRRRTGGWRKPPGAAVVDRTTAWGNPWRIARGRDGWRVFRLVDGAEVDVAPCRDEDLARRVAVDRYRAHLAARPDLVTRARAELAGRDLLCPCPEGAVCHGDVLLDVAAGRLTFS